MWLIRLSESHSSSSSLSSGLSRRLAARGLVAQWLMSDVTQVSECTSQYSQTVRHRDTQSLIEIESSCHRDRSSHRVIKWEKTCHFFPSAPKKHCFSCNFSSHGDLLKLLDGPFYFCIEFDGVFYPYSVIQVGYRRDEFRYKVQKPAVSIQIPNFEVKIESVQEIRPFLVLQISPRISFPIENLNFPRLISPKRLEEKSCRPGFPIILGSSFKWDHFRQIRWQLNRPHCTDIKWAWIFDILWWTLIGVHFFPIKHYFILVNSNYLFLPILIRNIFFNFLLLFFCRVI